MVAAKLHLNDKSLCNERRANEAAAMLIQSLRKHLPRCGNSWQRKRK